MPTVETPAVSRAGITTSASGERHIPASRRADGSVRKEIRVRPGYRPPEDVELYKNRSSEAWRTRGSAGVPGAESLKPEPTPADAKQNLSAAAAKNAKRRETRKKAAASAGETHDQDGKDKENKENEVVGAKEVKEEKKTEVAKEEVDPEVKKEKEAKKLAKKLRQARDLKDKKEKGDALLPEQFEKVIKINELMRQLEGLGFDSNGERKQET